MLVGGGQREHREPLRQIFLQPGREFGGGLGVVGDELLEPLFGGEATGASVRLLLGEWTDGRMGNASMAAPPFSLGR